jgi:ketosteroid isomerase-like protein
MTAVSDSNMLLALTAKDEIRDLVYSYCQAVDRHDFDKLATLYHEGAVDEHGFNATGSAAEFFAKLPTLVAHAAVQQHNVTNITIRVDGSYAEGECYFIAYHLWEDPDGHSEVLLGGRYLDKYERRDGVWKIRQRRVVGDWLRTNHGADNELDHPKAAGMYRGRKDAKDPAYEFFRLFRRGAR